MSVYAESSAILAWLLGEESAGPVRQILAAADLVLASDLTLVECDRQNRRGSGFVDLWKLALDGSGKAERLTYFSDSPGYKASNGVVSDDGKLVAFQLAKSTEAAGVGHGIFVLDLTKAKP